MVRVLCVLVGLLVSSLGHSSGTKSIAPCTFEANQAIWKLMKEKEPSSITKLKIQTAVETISSDEKEITFRSCGYEKFRPEKGPLTENYYVTLDVKSCRVVKSKITGRETCPAHL